MDFGLVLLGLMLAGMLAATYQKPVTQLSPAMVAWDEYQANRAAEKAATGDYT